LWWGGGGGAHSLAGDGVGESQFRRGDIHCGTLFMYFVSCPLGMHSSIADSETT
jgi:hypothetical protein